MKRILTASAIALIAFGGTAFGMASHSTQTFNEIRQYAPSVDPSQLTDAQIAMVNAVIHGGESKSEKHVLIQSLLRLNN